MRVSTLQNIGIHGTILTVREGYLVCPICKRNRRLLRISPETQATRLPIYCRDCKNSILIDIESGQCYESRSR